MEGLIYAIDTQVGHLVRNPDNHDFLSLVKGARNGLVYGAKIRFPHALVMAILFRNGSWRDKARFIMTATRQHAINLARFVLTYKTAMIAQSRLRGLLTSASSSAKGMDASPAGIGSSSAGPLKAARREGQFDSFFAGLVGGYLVFREDNPVNQQIVLYVFSRVFLSVVKTMAKRDLIPQHLKPDPRQGFAIFASITWGLVMYLFRWEDEYGKFNDLFVQR